MSDAADYGERKHETCRFGRLTEAYSGPALDMKAMKPGVAPLCTWALPEPCPPGLRRQWGGLVDFERDCAVCLAHKAVDAA